MVEERPLDEAASRQTAVTTPARTILLKDPTLGAYVFFSKHLPAGVIKDPREDFLALLDRATQALSLDLRGAAKYPSTDEVRLLEVHLSAPDKEDVVNLFHKEEYQVNQ